MGGGGEERRERERERETHTHRETQRDRERERERVIETIADDQYRSYSPQTFHAPCLDAWALPCFSLVD